MSSDFNASVFVSEQVNRQLVNLSQDLSYRCIAALAEHYNFDAEEASRYLNLSMIKVERKVPIKGKSAKAPKVSAPKAAFPLPYNGEFNDACCYALRQNNGLYTQCTSLRRSGTYVCKGCDTTMQKTGSEVPEYGTIQQRNAVGIFEYTDPKGRKPIAYTKVMKKYKISQEQAIEEATKLNIIINSEHFVVAEETKRGRPSTKGGEKSPKEKGAKGRPKKSKKVLQIDGDDEDLFATLVAEANEESEESSLALSNKKVGKSEEERLAKEAEKETKRLAAEVAKKEKEEKLAAEKAEKEAKKEQERLAREAKKAEEEAAKKLKEEQRLKDKAEKEAKLAAEKAALAKQKEATKSQKSSKKEVVEDEEPDVVKKVEFEGKKYLKSKNTGIVYDYSEYVKNSEQVVVGKWNDSTNKIVFAAAEEEEEEYDM
jgi:chemotaxis protein histidine kinase CheA